MREDALTVTPARGSTVTFTVSVALALPSCTVREKVSTAGSDRAGAVNVGLAALEELRATVGPPDWDHP